ncbi:MAG: bifunctional phosphopantothenoylcysteine decarboxylase/phosphopantothenate--cysteine ligase CoaBC [Actinomycetia bacterium]|nr:bifunctional phosphopantothenoylcysteine decarboxylase/phosphopantothenate--cysteine ligase CoaBC [Actinomycetes bacterium]
MTPLSAPDVPADQQIVVGVAGGISAYKVCGLVRLFKESGYSVQVIPTESALEFVGAPTWAALSGNPVSSSVWESVADVPHVRLGQEADLLVVAPATANLLAKAATGLADDLLTNTLLTARCPIIFAPAMHTEMWEHPATQHNVATLQSRGHLVLPPDSGRLTGSDTGPGRLPDIAAIYAVAAAQLAGISEPDMQGQRVVISAGGTQEPLDPVRYLGNHSSGKMGHALAATALVRGADVTLVSANITLPELPGVQTISVQTAAQLQDAMISTCADADIVVMAAAVADFRPESAADTKIKKQTADAGLTLDLVQNPDILADLVGRRAADQTIVGFAAETGDAQASVLELGQQKLARKQCDFLVVNDVSDDLAFGSDNNQVTVLAAAGSATQTPRADKTIVANQIWDVVCAPRQNP